MFWMLNTIRGKIVPLYLEDCTERHISWFKRDDQLYVKQNMEKLNRVCRSQFSVLEVTLLIFSNNSINMAFLTLEVNLICYASIL